MQKGSQNPRRNCMKMAAQELIKLSSFLRRHHCYQFLAPFSLFSPNGHPFVHLIVAFSMIKL